MNLWADADAFMQKRQGKKEDAPALFSPENPDERERFVATVRQLYENATRGEIERALNQVLESMDKPYAREAVLKKMRVKLED